jgi:hypothetical protein
LRGRFAGAVLVGAGSVLLLPQVCAWTLFGALRDDVAAAFVPTVRVPLASLTEGTVTVVSFKVPQTAGWERIRRTWGDPGYVIVAAHGHGPVRDVVPYSSLNLSIHVATGADDLPLEVATKHPFLYSSDTRDYGLAFHAPAGRDVTVRVEALGPTVDANGELTIRPYWDPATAQGMLVTSDIEGAVRSWAALLGFCGAWLLGIAVGRRGGPPVAPAHKPLQTTAGGRAPS